MARRRRSDGLVDDLLQVAVACPAAGLGAAAAFGLMALATHLHAPEPGSAALPPDVGSIASPLLYLVLKFVATGLAAAALLGSLIGMVRCLATGRDLLGRERAPYPVAWRTRRSGSTGHGPQRRTGRGGSGSLMRRRRPGPGA